VGRAASTEVGVWPDHVAEEWTVEALETLPDNSLRYEILDGTLIVSPAPTPLHQRVVVRMVLLLTAACPDDHEVFVAPLVWQPDRRTSLEPDLLVVRKVRIGPRSITQTPTLVAEVTGTARIDRMIKFSRYAEGGISQYWIVDPAVPSVEVYDLTDDGYALVASGTADDVVVVSRPLNLKVIPQGLVGE